jgi:hypothetical protein
MCVFVEKPGSRNAQKADGLRKKLQTSVSDDPCTRERARRRELAAFSTLDDRMLGGEETPTDVMRLDERERGGDGRNRQCSLAMSR